MLNKPEALSVAEWRRAEAIKIAIMGRKGLDMSSDELDGHGSDFDRVMRDAEYIENWIGLAAEKERREAALGGVGAGGDCPSQRRWVDSTGLPPHQSEFHVSGPGGIGQMTFEQIDYLREMLPAFSRLGPIDLVREYYRKLPPDLGRAGNAIWHLPLAADVSEPEQDQLAFGERGFVMRYDGGDWRLVDEFPGYRLAGGDGTISRPHRIYWAPGVWPPVTEGAAAKPFRSGDVERTGDQLAASEAASVEDGVA